MRDRLLRNVLRERFLVTLKSGASFDGLLDEWSKDHFVFVDAGSMADAPGQSRQRVAIQGELWIARADIDYMQKLPR